MSGTNTAGASPFTVSQWHELEHQALIFKYLMAGMRIPPDLLLPIRKSFDSISPNFYHHPTMAYCSLYGKKVDPEPGRCKRTDGKKWRCSKDAYLDSKYCERHMHRGRSRSRKPVESQTASQTVSTVTKMTGSSGGGAGSSQNFPLHSFDNPPPGGPGSGSNSSHFNMDSIPYGIPNRDYWYPHKYKTDVGEHSFFEASGSHQMDSPLDNNTWPLMPSRISSFPQSKSVGNNLVLQSDYPQSSFFGSEFGSGQPGKQECQSLRPFFDEWPRTRNSWSPHEEQSSQTSFSTTQLSMSIPMTSPDLSTDSRSSHDD